MAHQQVPDQVLLDYVSGKNAALAEKDKVIQSKDEKILELEDQVNQLKDSVLRTEARGNGYRLKYVELLHKLGNASREGLIALDGEQAEDEQDHTYSVGTPKTPGVVVPIYAEGVEEEGEESAEDESDSSNSESESSPDEDDDDEEVPPKRFRGAVPLPLEEYLQRNG